MNIRRYLALLSLALLVGCPTKPQVTATLDLDEKLMEPCDKELPRLESSLDTDVQKWMAKMSTIYVLCANKHSAQTGFILRYNARVKEANDKLAKKVQP